MLTKELLFKNQKIKGANIPDDVLAAIFEISEEDENKVIAGKTREIWDSVDGDIESITGVKRPASTKSFDHLKTELKKHFDLGKKGGEYDGLKTKYDELEATNKDLEEKIKKGSTDEALKGKVTELETKVKDKDKLIEEWKTKAENDTNEWKTKYEEEVKVNHDSRVDSVFGLVRAELKFKSNVPEVAIDAVFNEAKRKVLSESKAVFEKSGNESVLMFRDQNEGLRYNSKDGNKPHTAKSLIMPFLEEVIDNSGGRGGGGGSGGSGGGGGNFDLTSARSRSEFTTILQDSLAKDGKVAGMGDYEELYQKAIDDNKEFYEGLPFE